MKTKLLRLSEAEALCRELGIGRQQLEAWCKDPPALPETLWFRKILYGHRCHYNADAIRWLANNSSSSTLTNKNDQP